VVTTLRSSAKNSVRELIDYTTYRVTMHGNMNIKFLMLVCSLLHTSRFL